MARQKSVLTTGEIAKICSVAPRTVSKWFDSGQLRGYRIPGSRDRRVPIEQLIRFMRAHNIPLNGLDGGMTRVLVASPDAALAAAIREALARDESLEVRTATNVLEAALITAWFRPQYLFVDLDLAGFSPDDLFRAMREHAELSVRHAVAITASGRDGDLHRLREMGFADCLVKPFDASRIANIIQTASTPAQ